ncbi:MAG: outer membrane beta-barrel protein [Saprospiraceae bacterium]|nr:outer membrane beta-barrel protein [Saprospiraceae bacterium]
MGNKEWDNHLRDLLGDFKSEGEPSHWEEFEHQLDITSDPAESAERLQDEILKDKLSSYSPPDQVTGWDRIEASLDAAESEFDDQVRTRISEFQPPKDPHSWPLFQQRFAAHKLLRAKLIALKVFETAAMILLLITILHLGHLGKLPMMEPPADDLHPNELQEMATNQNTPTGNVEHADLTQKSTTPATATILPEHTKRKASIPSVIGPDSRSNHDATNTYSSVTSSNNLTNSDLNTFPDIHEKVNVEATPFADSYTEGEFNSTGPPHNFGAGDNQSEVILSASNNTFISSETYVTESLAQRACNLTHLNVSSIPDPVFVKPVQKTFLEFGMLAQVDYNQLKMPEDRLYNNGKQVIFPLQGLTSPGYGAGFTLALAHARWAIETGAIYSAKSFSPGRELTVGITADHSNVEFDAMRMQLISVPLQFRYRIEPKGRLKAYALAGFGLHLIAQSDIDVLVKYNFPSLPEGENPNNNPSLARTIRETKRVSDDFREKAPFSTTSYISANLGAGLEYRLTERKTIFLQAAYQYQIPNLRFSNHNGKHLLSVSMQAGVRTPLGS